MNSLLAALGLMLVLEGALPFLAPTLWRETCHKYDAQAQQHRD